VSSRVVSESHEAYETLPSARLEYPVADAEHAVECGGLPPASLLRSHSKPWRTPGTPCLFLPCCARIRGSQAAVWSTSASLSSTVPRSCKALQSAFQLRFKAPQRPNLEPSVPEGSPQNTSISGKQAELPRRTVNFGRYVRCLFALDFAPEPLSGARKCKLLLHLGNSVAFFIDKPDTLPYDFSCQHSR
jgi:hypothetical protein